jgi:hypothetical protein
MRRSRPSRPTRAGERCAPTSATAFTPLSVVIDGVTLNAHMFTAEAIEFDLDPREIAGAHQFGSLIRFMSFLADAVSKPVVLTPENGPREPSEAISRPACTRVGEG